METLKTTSPKKLLTPTEAGEILGVGPNTLVVWRSRRAPNIPFLKIGRLVRYDREALEAWIAKQRVGGDAA